VDHIWDGAFILIWKPPFAPPHQLSPGARGANVLWIRRALDTLEKKTPSPPTTDAFDDDLKQRILRFQQDRSLIQDGFVGSETLVRLAAASGGSDTPSLIKSTR
jgi:general secretion pathway protein A